jgi:hypothetical protein
MVFMTTKAQATKAATSAGWPSIVSVEVNYDFGLGMWRVDITPGNIGAEPLLVTAVIEPTERAAKRATTALMRTFACEPDGRWDDNIRFFRRTKTTPKVRKAS